jgi:hypothetical protein
MAAQTGQTPDFEGLTLEPEEHTIPKPVSGGWHAKVAQLVEHTTENRSVDSSILSFGTTENTVRDANSRICVPHNLFINAFVPQLRFFPSFGSSIVAHFALPKTNLDDQ